MFHFIKRLEKEGFIAAALLIAIVALTTKVDSLNVSDLMQFAGDLSVATKGLDEGGILQGLLKLHEGKKE